MLKRVDESKFLIQLLERLSALIAKWRGVPIIVGVVMILVGFIIQLVNFGVNSIPLDIVQASLHNGGILLALIGILLRDPIG